MTSILHFIHVNISSTHISTSTHNMTFYVQVVTRTQSSHLMAISTHKLITCQYVRTHILTSNMSPLSQAMTLSNKSYNDPEASHNNHKPGHGTDPKQAISIGLNTVTSSPKQSGSPRRVKPRLSGPETPIIMSPGSPRHTYLHLGLPIRLGEHFFA